tara:strand:- start:514 stop:1485 length:972 start_codon:yes stop_codon:yes gene_type:complete
MGIIHLNRFLLDNCKRSSIKKVKLDEFSGKTIAIDTSIYMYKYLSQNALVENFYSMISLFRSHSIHPIFVFDGKPPPEKKEVLEERKLEKANAEEKCKTLEQEFKKNEEHLSPEEKKQYLQEIEELKNQCIRVKRREIDLIKKLMTLYGVCYYESEGEADEVCASLVLSGKAWACMSDDMDMFVYGCTRVLRHFSIVNKNVLCYDLENILTDLKMDMKIFREICVLSGTDYNIRSNTSLNETIRWYEEYLKDKSDKDFYTWLLKYTKYISDVENLHKIYQMFCLKEKTKLCVEHSDLQEYNQTILHEFLKDHGFVFPQSQINH